MNKQTPTAASADVSTPAQAPADPPHGGSWLRKPDGTLQLLHSTKPTFGRVQRVPEPTVTKTSEE